MLKTLTGIGSFRFSLRAKALLAECPMPVDATNSMMRSLLYSSVNYTSTFNLNHSQECADRYGLSVAIVISNYSSLRKLKKIPHRLEKI